MGQGLQPGLPAGPRPDPKASRPVPGLIQVQVLPTPGGRDSGRLSLSVRTWLAEAAAAADSKGRSGGRSPPHQKRKCKLFGECLNLGEYSDGPGLKTGRIFESSAYLCRATYLFSSF